VERQVQAWFTPLSPGLFSPSRFPIYLHEEEDGSAFYGFPSLDGSTVKAAQHHGGEEISPEEPRRDALDTEALLVLEHLGRLIPGLVGAGLARTKVCMYTDSRTSISPWACTLPASWCPWRADFPATALSSRP
jgi:sarcosine oxidase